MERRLLEKSLATIRESLIGEGEQKNAERITRAKKKKEADRMGSEKLCALNSKTLA